MKPFALAAVLRHRERAEAQQQERHSAAVQRRLVALEQMGALQARQRQVLHMLAECQRQVWFDVQTAEQLLRYHDALAAVVQAQAALVENATREVERERAALLRAAQDRQALERLKERHDTEEQRAAARHAIREQDGITTARYVAVRAAAATEGRGDDAQP